MKLQRLLTRIPRLIARYKRRAEEEASAAKIKATFERPVWNDTNRAFGEWLHTKAGRVWRRKRGAA